MRYQTHTRTPCACPNNCHCCHKKQLTSLDGIVALARVLVHPQLRLRARVEVGQANVWHRQVFFDSAQDLRAFRYGARDVHLRTQTCTRADT